ncbi:ecto-NOX disulfide-thiol exchanger 2-like [Amphibalanus amphitrite]|uniref:ecto-NOX disulfide-thiol exchanger 2-like n=1 Tax=Amphibalanus amphitrite TaxID=1232801 RepID=UPI001C903DA2|nr:ecto-NOX disulfide-thiol exchanger 2-like [Amphibalanus amphitrite]XP_043203089.1 ecto-NOX disulfide-thiol exchanger 2-like [Amphibalanus amphitrite]XP_043203090.1 ecto-NOX disulfide-thiol exchanger 2-like [Amphibalanus amphitrite]XP_043203091.1 ecto-NOX disulfide-thiol exchanger 2-like [Amphibalanus amphitrite]XP_043203092.1 ecto-NOX disulfide-thiol exchanger 2-like [Amphibalanus amphitrite]
MSGYGMGPGPGNNNQPLEFGNRLGSGAAPSGGTNGSPDTSDRRGPRSRGGLRGGRSGPGRGYQDNGGPDSGGGDYNGRRGDGRRDRSRWEGAPGGHGGGNMQAGGGMAPGGMSGLPNNGAPLLPAPPGPPQAMVGGGPDQMAMGGGGGGPVGGGQFGGGPQMWDMPPPEQQQPQPPQPQGPSMMGYNMGGMEMNNMGAMDMNNMGAFMGSAGAVDPSMMMTTGQYNLLPAGMQQPLYPQLPGTWMPDGNFVPIKEVITCSECVLYPPNPNARPPMTRERPPGCRTAFIGGLPENITEDILRDVFRRCGEISSLRMSQKNFAHIRFELEVYVEYAIMLSGYRMKIRDETDAANTGRLHCDYAQARDDTYEWECQQRVLQREMRHRQRQLEDMNRPPSPPPVSHYSHHEAQQLLEKIKEESTFGESVQLLTTWLERGDCNKRTAGNFYSMIQSTNSHVRRLMSERSVIEEELAKMREQARLRQQQVIVQFGQIERVFLAACQQKVWDHFSKAQRKNIELWKKQASEIKKIQIDELSGERADDEMDLSDDEEPSKKRARKQAQDEQHDATDALRCQLEAYKNEAEMVRHEHKEELDAKDAEMDIMRKTMQNVQQQLLTTKSRETALEQQLQQLKAQLARLTPMKNKKDGDGKEAVSSKEKGAKEDTSGATEDSEQAERDAAYSPLPAAAVDGGDARIIGLSAAFLNVHPEGASCDYIWSYLQQFPGYVLLSPRDVETALGRYGRVFKEVVSGVGAKLERKWTFVGYTPPPQEAE